MEDGDKEALALWSTFRDLSWKEFTTIYERLGVQFDVISGESKFSDKMQDEIIKLKEKGILTESKGAMVVDLKDYDLGVAIITKKDGATIYITRDIAAASYRKETYNFDEMYYVVAVQQDHHFKQLFKLLDLMGYSWSKDCHHINFGMVMGMSTRKGNVVFLEDMLEEAKFTMLEVMKKNEKKFFNVQDPEAIADKVGIAAIIIQDFSSRRVKDYKFDWKRMTSFEGNTGPFLQYSHARLCSIETKAAERGILINSDVPAEEFLKEKEATDLITLLSQYPSILQQADKVLEPCIIVNYLMSLAHSISLAHEKLHVLNLSQEERALAESRLLMFWCARITLKNGMTLLGLSPVEKM
jgi:arginyl-tRNA synthetase